MHSVAFGNSHCCGADIHGVQCIVDGPFRYPSPYLSPSQHPLTLDLLETYWGKDAQEFRPERWETDQVCKEAFVPFHLGPQTCKKNIFSIHMVLIAPLPYLLGLGRSMAYLEAKTLLSLILQRFDVKLVPGQEVE